MLPSNQSQKTGQQSNKKNTNNWGGFYVELIPLFGDCVLENFILELAWQ